MSIPGFAIIATIATYWLLARGERIEDESLESDLLLNDGVVTEEFASNFSAARLRLAHENEFKESLMLSKRRFEALQKANEELNSTNPTPSFRVVQPSYSISHFQKAHLDPRLEAHLKAISIQTDGISDIRVMHWSCGADKVDHKHLTIYFPYDGSTDPRRWQYPHDVAMHNLAAYLPAAIAMIRCKKDLQDVIYALNLFPGTPYCIKSGGHDYRAASACRGVMIDISRMYYHGFDPKTNIMWANTGANLGMLTWYLRAVNRIFPHGDSVAVGLGGHALHGGWDGLTARKYGLLTHHIKSGKAILWNGAEATFDANTNFELLFLARGGGFEEVGVVYEIEIYTHPRPTNVCCVGRGALGVPAANWLASGFNWAASAMPIDLHIGMKITHTGAGFGLCHLNKKCKDWSARDIATLNTQLYGPATDWHFAHSSQKPTLAEFPNGRPSGPLPKNVREDWTQEQFVDDVFAKRLEPYNLDVLKQHWQMGSMMSFQYEHNPDVFSQFDRYVEMAQGYLTQRSFYVPKTALAKPACANLFQKVDAVVKQAKDAHTCVDIDGKGPGKAICEVIDQHKFHAFTTIAAGGGALKDWNSLMAARQASGIPQDRVGAAIRAPGEVWIFRYECHWYVPDAKYKTFCWELTRNYENAVGPCASEGIYFADRWQNSWGETAFFGENAHDVGAVKHTVWSLNYGNAFYGELPNMWR